MRKEDRQALQQCQNSLRAARRRASDLESQLLATDALLTEAKKQKDDFLEVAHETVSTITALCESHNTEPTDWNAYNVACDLIAKDEGRED